MSAWAFRRMTLAGDIDRGRRALDFLDRQCQQLRLSGEIRMALELEALVAGKRRALNTAWSHLQVPAQPRWLHGAALAPPLA